MLRTATNASEFISLIKNGFQLDVEVIPSNVEARYSYLAIRTDETFSPFDAGNLIVTDIGSGSTEFVSLDKRRCPPS